MGKDHPRARILRLPNEDERDRSPKYHCPSCCKLLGYRAGRLKDDSLIPIIIVDELEYFCSKKCFQYYVSEFGVK